MWQTLQLPSSGLVILWGVWQLLYSTSLVLGNVSEVKQWLDEEKGWDADRRRSCG
jgi:hypothetical protein